MKALIKKEIRLLLPAWITAMVLAIALPVFMTIGSENFGAYDAFPVLFFTELIIAIGLLLLGINSFGQELSCHTFSALLSQPMNRPRFWLIKVAILAMAFISVWLTAMLFISWQVGILDITCGNGYVYRWFPQMNQKIDFRGAFEFLSLSALVLFSGGLWTTLLFRQLTAAIWFTLLVPMAIIFGVGTVFEKWIGGGNNINTFIMAALVLYSVGGFILAWRLFMRAQDVQWTGGDISLPFGKSAAKTRSGAEIVVGSWRRGTHLRSEATGGQVAALPVRTRHRFSALAWKELQLHQGAFVIAAIVLALHLAAICVRRFHPHIQNPDLDTAVNVIWVLWLLMPFLIGATAIAEERRMGTLEPQLCLPIPRGAQLFFKFCIALALSLVFGAVAPVLIERTNILDLVRWVFVVATAIFLVSFYASSLGRTTLQSIGLAVLVALVVCAQEFWDDFSSFGNTFAAQTHYLDTFEVQTRYLDAAILLILYGWLTYSNFKHRQQNLRFWMRNILAVLAVFVCFRVLNYAIIMAALQWYDRHYL